MASLNKVLIMGNLTRDPQVRYTPGGTAVTDLGVALNRVWYDKQTREKREDVTFVDVTLWARNAEIAGEYLSKGRPVLIEGRLQLDQWEDRDSGQKRSKLKVVGEQLTLLPGGRGDSGPRGGGYDSGPGRNDSQNAPDEPPPHEAFYQDSPGNDAPDDDAPDDDVPF